jgi:hypothetical protein
MKLLNCTRCNDIIALTTKVVRTCACQSSRGAYRDGGVVAVIAGEPARVLGMLNSEYVRSMRVPTVPWSTYYRWFPILTQHETGGRLEHNVLKVPEAEFDRALNPPSVDLTFVVPLEPAQ